MLLTQSAFRQLVDAASQADFNPAAEQVNLADRLPIQPQTDEQWQARRALLEYAEREPLDFHSPYGCSKGAADQYIHDYARIYALL